MKISFEIPRDIFDKHLDLFGSLLGSYNSTKMLGHQKNQLMLVSAQGIRHKYVVALTLEFKILPQKHGKVSTYDGIGTLVFSSMLIMHHSKNWKKLAKVWGKYRTHGPRFR